MPPAQRNPQTDNWIYEWNPRTNQALVYAHVLDAEGGNRTLDRLEAEHPGSAGRFWLIAAERQPSQHEGQLIDGFLTLQEWRNALMSLKDVPAWYALRSGYLQADWWYDDDGEDLI